MVSGSWQTLPLSSVWWRSKAVTLLNVLWQPQQCDIRVPVGVGQPRVAQFIDGSPIWGINLDGIKRQRARTPKGSGLSSHALDGIMRLADQAPLVVAGHRARS